MKCEISLPKWDILSAAKLYALWWYRQYLMTQLSNLLKTILLKTISRISKCFSSGIYSWSKHKSVVSYNPLFIFILITLQQISMPASSTRPSHLLLWYLILSKSLAVLLLIYFLRHHSVLLLLKNISYSFQCFLLNSIKCNDCHFSSWWTSETSATLHCWSNNFHT